MFFQPEIRKLYIMQEMLLWETLKDNELVLCAMESTVFLLTYKQMLIGLEVMERTIWLLPESYSGLRSARFQIGDPWELHTFYCFLTTSSMWNLCERPTLSVAHLAFLESDHWCASSVQYVRHRIKQELLWGLRIQYVLIYLGCLTLAKVLTLKALVLAMR